MNRPFIDIKRLITCCLLFAGAVCGHARSGGVEKDSAAYPVTLHFPMEQAGVDSSYMGNARALVHLHRLFADSSLAARVDSVGIFSFASPDGGLANNLRLAQKRSVAVKGYIMQQYPFLDDSRIRLHSLGEDWQGLRRLIEQDDSLPCREEVLLIIDRTATDNHRCKLLLKKLDGGTPYRYIARHILPHLRNASVCTVYFKNLFPALNARLEKVSILRSVPLPLSSAAETDTLSSLSSLSSADFKSAETEYKDFQSATLSDSAYDRYLADLHRLSPRRVPLLALKTNLLFDLALMPNFEVELPIGKHNRYSLNGEIMFPWWLIDKNKYCLQILMGGLEARYWLGSRRNRANREVLTGHFLGLYAGGGKYDLQWNRDGYQGEFFIAAGISYGYAHKIARNLRLEYNIGIGLLRTNYEYYHTLDNYHTLLWQNNGRYTWLGPTKLKVSLVWLLNRKVKLKKGGAR